MEQHPLGDAPRRLPLSEATALVLGHPATVLGALALVLASSLLWTFVASYGLEFSALRPLAQSRERLPGQVESSQTVQLWNGEPAHRTTALFSYQGKLYRASAYGLPPRPHKGGQTVTVVVPGGKPEQSWIEGQQKFPVRLSSLGPLAALAFLPGSLLSLWGLLAGLRQRKTVLVGAAVRARRVRHLPLPRPLADRFLDRFAFSEATGKAGAVWSVGCDGPEERWVLVSPHVWRHAVVLDYLLPEGRQEKGLVKGTNKGRRIAACTVLGLWLGGTGVLLLFFLT